MRLGGLALGGHRARPSTPASIPARRSTTSTATSRADAAPLGRFDRPQLSRSIGWRGIRQRKLHVEELLRDGDATACVRRAGRCGCRHRRRPRPLRARCARQRRRQPDSILLRDYSDINVAAGAQLIARRGSPAIARFVQGRRLRPRRASPRSTPQPTLGIVSGLYELFPDNAMVRRSLAGLAGGDAARRLPRLHRPALASAARADRPRADQPPRRARPGSCAGARRPRWTSWSRPPASARSTQRIDEWGIFTVSLAERVPLIEHRASADDPTAAASVAARAALWLASWRRSSTSPTARPIGSPSRRARCRRSIVFAWERADPVPGLDDRALLVDQRLLRRCRCSSAPREPSSTRTRAACSPRKLIAVACFIAVPAALHFRAAGDADGVAGFLFAALAQLRPAVQPGAVAAHRAAGDPLGALRPPCAALGTVAAACLVPADRRLGADHLSAPFHRHPDRRAAGLLCLWLWPDGGASPLATFHVTDESSRRPRHSSARYLVAGVWSPRWRFGSAAPACGCCGRPCRSSSSPRTTRSSVRPDSRNVRRHMSLAARVLLAPICRRLYQLARLDP